jgi:hypothetical protein
MTVSNRLEEYPFHMELAAFAVFVIPFVGVIYLIALLFIQPTRVAFLASLLGGLVMSVLNALVDLLAYYTHLWHYTLSGLTMHLPLPYYVVQFLVYGSIDYLLIWRLWRGRFSWLARVLLFGTPIVAFLRDLNSALGSGGDLHWDSPLAAPLDLVMWLLIFYAGYWIFRQLTPAREVASPESLSA